MVLREIRIKKEELRKRIEGLSDIERYLSKKGSVLEGVVAGIDEAEGLLFTTMVHSEKNKEDILKYRIKEEEKLIKRWEDYTSEKDYRSRGRLAGLKYVLFLHINTKYQKVGEKK